MKEIRTAPDLLFKQGDKRKYAFEVDFSFRVSGNFWLNGRK
jgi:hypothetical protein